MKRAAVLGHPIAHSLSPILHNAAYQALGLDWGYEAIDSEPSQLFSFLDESLLNSNEWAGFSLTMPLKVHVVPWLNSVAERGFGSIEIDPLVTATGAANTLVRNSLLAAYNTDVYGIIRALREVVRHGPISNIAILGTGATAASALVAAKELGAASVVVFGRPGESLKHLREVAARLGFHVNVRGVPHQQINFTDYHVYYERPIKNLNNDAGELCDFSAVISTLPAHVADPIANSLRRFGYGCAGALLDVVYDPRPTSLEATWSALGGAIVGGERMLLHQAAKQVELMTGLPAPVAAMEAALDEALEARQC